MTGNRLLIHQRIHWYMGLKQMELFGLGVDIVDTLA